MKKIWQVLPKIKDEFIDEHPGYDRLLLQLLFNRGLKTKEEIENFLSPDEEKTVFDSFLFKDMEKAVELIIEHIKAGNKIVVYGDYDADGVTASAVLVEALATFKALVEVYIPERVSEGYGLNKEAIKEIAKGGAKLIITVDNGIRNKAEAEYGKSLGLEIIITDHHTPPVKAEDLPACLIINPKIENEIYPFKNLAGVGVAAKLAQALTSKAKLAAGIKEQIRERARDLIAIGTVADCVTLLGENRVLVKKGLEVLNQTRRLGLKELIKVSSLDKGRPLDSWNIGFQIGPRLNAAGRLEHANTSFELLITKNKEEAEALARRLNDRNINRQEITAEIVEEVEKQINEQDKIIVGIYQENLEAEAWNEGVIGLAAGRICDKLYRPAIVITKSQNIYKGSARSIPEFNIIRAVEELGYLLDKFGGHPAACGFSLKAENLAAFSGKIKKIAEQKLKGLDLAPKLKIEAELDLAEINEELAEEINKLAPFGQDNERPLFISRAAIIADIIKMGIDGQHLKLRLKSENSLIINALGFGQAEQWPDLQIGEKIDIVYYIEINEFNGRREAQIKIVDIKKT